MAVTQATESEELGWWIMLRFAYKPTNTKNPTNNIVTKNHFKITGYILCCKNLVAWRQPNYTYLHIFYTVDDDIKR